MVIFPVARFTLLDSTPAIFLVTRSTALLQAAQLMPVMVWVSSVVMFTLRLLVYTPMGYMVELGGDEGNGWCVTDKTRGGTGVPSLCAWWALGAPADIPVLSYKNPL